MASYNIYRDVFFTTRRLASVLHIVVVCPSVRSWEFYKDGWI